MRLIFSAATIGFVLSLALQSQAQALSCHQVHSLKTASAKTSEPTPYKESFKTNNEPPRDKRKYFQDLNWLVRNILPEVRHELSKINNNVGSDIEIAQTKSFLNKVLTYELDAIHKIKPIDNAVIYGSTNVPFYTLITQVFLTASFSKNVWVRTPESTREIYIHLFEMLKTNLPREYTDNIHLVTEASDLTYDTFNRIFVMGLSRNGHKSVRPPSELVILTGNPDTARSMIDRNIRNLEKIADGNVGRQQLFLGFLAGVNPAVVVPSAKSNLNEVVNKLTFPFLVNGGQDCMNSDIVFVHNEVLPSLKSELLGKLESMRSQISPLTMSKNLNHLKSYREKYKKYLITPEATIDEATKTVSPHVFVFPYSEFKNLDIQEHFAPFVSIVRFENFEQLEKASMDPRIQKKAMFSLIFGSERMSPDLQRARNIFRQAQHGVVTNTHLYDEFEMNMPFGGIGTDTSMSVLARMTGSGKVQVENRNRPLLISKEVESVYGQDRGTVPQPNAELIPAKTRKSALFRDMQKFAEERGLSIALRGNFASNDQKKEAQKLYGIRFAIPHEDGRLRKVQGVVLHPIETHKYYENPSILGEQNPLLADVSLLKKYNSKMEELKLVRSLNPSLMPGVKTFSEEFTGAHLESFRKDQETLLHQLQTLPKTLTPQQQQTVDSQAYLLVANFLSGLQSRHPRGVFVKNYGEYASGDLGNAITSFNASAVQIAKEFMLMYRQARIKYPAKGFLSPEIQNFIKSGDFANNSRFVNKLLTRPEELIIQERVDLAQTQQGLPMEFRVDFIQGQVVGSRMRFGSEYYPTELEISKQVLQNLLNQAPTDIKDLSGGADVFLTRDGKWGIFEFNFGAASGTLAPEYYPFEANQIFSNLQKQNTWLMDFAHQVFKSSIEKQKQFIQSRKNEKPIWWRMSVDEISQVEWARWLRDQYLERWRKSAKKKETATEVLAQIQTLLSDLGTNDNLDFQRLHESAEHFVQREIAPNK